MSEVTVKIDIENIIDQLTEEQQNELSRILKAKEMDKIVSKMRSDVKKKGLSSQQINEIIEKARKEFHAESSS